MVNSKKLEDGIRRILNNDMNGYVDIDDTYIPFGRCAVHAINLVYAEKIAVPIREQDLVWHNMDKLKAVKAIEGFDRKTLLHYMESSGMMANIKPYTQAQEVITAIGWNRNMPFMTSRLGFYKDAIAMTTEWEQRQVIAKGFPARKIIYDSDKLAVSKARGFMFAFEDHGPTILELLKEGMYVFMHSMPHNRIGRKDAEMLDVEELEKKSELINELKRYENKTLFVFDKYNALRSRILYR